MNLDVDTGNNYVWFWDSEKEENANTNRANP